MNIQQNLNAMLTMAAVGARTSDTYKKNVEYRSLSKAEKTQQIINDKLFEKNEAALEAEKFDPIVQKMEQKGLQDLSDISTEKAKIFGKQEDIDKAVQAAQTRDMYERVWESGKKEQTEYEQLEQNKKDLAAGKYQAFTKQDRAEADAYDAYDSETNNQRNIKKGMKERKGIVSAKAAGKALDDVFKNLGGKK